MSVKLSPQETKIVEYLQNKQTEYWENLAQFAKNPTTVKLKTIQKIISDLKKKYKEDNANLPFNCELKSLISSVDNGKFTPKADPSKETIVHNDQVLVKVRSQTKFAEAHKKLAEAVPLIKTEIQPIASKPSVPDFTVKHFAHQVVTRTGIYNLNSDDFEVFEYLITRRGKVINLEELRDKVCFPNWGSKMPSRWFESIQRRINNIRRLIPETKHAILTVKLENTTGYLFQ